MRSLAVFGPLAVSLRSLSWFQCGRWRFSDRYRPLRDLSGVIGRGCLPAAGHGSSFRLLARVVAVTGRGHAIPLAVFMSASGHGCGRFSPLSARCLGRAAGEPGVSCGRVW